MSWYRLYRPQTLSDLHLTTVREQLLRMVGSGSVPHALLFTGPKGTGKTSSARIIAKVLNCTLEQKGHILHEPCNACDLCLDITQGRSVNVIEIDAASNRRIDDVRDLKERIYTPPPVGKKLVFIIDEVHMMTNEAFNALLKILEEPPAHAVFILATTEFHKLPDTIVSRCTIVQFQKASTAELMGALQIIGQKEKVSVDDQVLTIIAERADGSFRDAVKLFQEVVNSGGKKLTLEVIHAILPTLHTGVVLPLVEAILAKDEHAIVQFFQLALQTGVNAQQLQKDLLTFLHAELLKSLGIEAGKSIASTPALQFLLKQFSLLVIDDRLPLPLLPIEITALEMVLKSKAQKSGSTDSGGSSHRATSALSTKVAQQSVPEPIVKKTVEPVSTPSIPEASAQPLTTDVIPSQNPSAADGSLLQHRWDELLKEVGANNLSIEALLRSSKFVKGEAGRVQIQVFYQFHKQQLELDRYKNVVQNCIQKVIGGVVKLEYVLAAPPAEVLGSAHSNVSGNVSEEVTELISMAEEALL